MFEEDKNNIESDILMRAILSDAKEEVPEHIWEGVSTELDRIQVAEVRKRVVLWMRRSAIAVAAAAAVTVGIIIDWNGPEEAMILPATDGMDMIAVAEPADLDNDNDNIVYDDAEVAPGLSGRNTDTILLADAEKEVKEAQQIAKAANEQETTDEQETIVAEDEKTAVAEDRKTTKEDPAAKVTFPEEWPEEDVAQSRKTRTAIVLNGITGTNSVQHGNGGGPLRRPTISTAPPVTGIKQTSTESTYGLPLSAGVGVKIGLAPRWSIGAGINYTLLTRKFYGTYTHVDDKGSVTRQVSSDIRNSQHYIGIPFNAYYDIIDRDHVNFYAYAGGAVEKCISDKYDVLSTSIIYKEKPAGVQLSANLGIGVEFLLGKHLGLYIDPSLRYYFDNGQPKSIRTDQPLMLGFEVGLRVNL